MKSFISGIVFAALVAIGGGAVMLFGGFINVAADEPHHPLVFNLLDTARERAIAHHADGITVPADLDDSERVRKGAGNYAAMCADCHLSPGVGESEIRLGLYPTPPNLARAGEDGAAPLAPAEAFWVIKHGIKASGMPAWGRGGMNDDDIWNLVALLKALPVMGLAEYRAWVNSSDGHAHGGQPAEEHDHGHGGGVDMPAQDHEGPPAHTHDEGTPHAH